MKRNLCIAAAALLAFGTNAERASPVAQQPTSRAGDDTYGKVFTGRAWVPQEEAVKTGWIEHTAGRWFPKAMAATLAQWEKEDKKHVAWADAWRLSSKHYRIRTNVPRHVVESEIMPFLDELYRTYVKVFKEEFGLEGKAANRKDIYIHNSYEDYATQNAEEGKPLGRGNSGFILGGSELVVFYDPTEPEEFYSTTFHEGAHQFVAAMLPGAEFPEWIGEALATWFEGCRWSRSAGRITLDFLSPERLDSAQELIRKAPQGGSLIEDMMGRTGDAFTAEHYCLAWSFVYYLTHADNRRYRKPFMQFLQKANGAGTKRSSRELFKQVVGVDPVELEAPWRAYVLGLRATTAVEWPVVSKVAGNATALDVKVGDLVQTIDGYQPRGHQDFARCWAARPKDRALKLVLVRRAKVEGAAWYRATRIELVIPPTATLAVECDAGQARENNLEG